MLIMTASIAAIAAIAALIAATMAQRVCDLAESRASEAIRLASLAIERVSSSRSSRLADSRSANTALAKALCASYPTCVGLGSENILSLDSGQESNSLRQFSCSRVSGSMAERSTRNVVLPA